MEDPAYIQSLFDANSNYSCYFQIGDPNTGPVERIGVVPPMLMAHSLVLRRALDVQNSDVKDKWDILVSDVTPRAFRNVLRYAYGFNIIKKQSLPHSVELLALAERWLMKTLSTDLANHIANILSPVNLCLAVRSPVGLSVKRVDDVMSKILRKSAKRVLGSPYLYMVCPAAMRYIVLHKSLRASDVDVWLAVMRWARNRVLDQSLLTYHLDLYLHPKLVVPCQKYIKLCSLNMIDLVDEILANHPNKQQNIEGIDKYHQMTVKPPRSLYLCTDSRHSSHLKHEEFQVKVVHMCEAWMTAVYLPNSTLTVTNCSDSPLELYSIVCCTKQEFTQDMLEDLEPVDPPNILQIPNDYNVCCLVKVFLIGNDESLIREVKFQADLAYGNDFQVQLSTKDERLQLLPNSKIMIETTFSKPHPLWYTHDIDHIAPRQNCDLELSCSVVNKESLYYGSHVKYVLYRKYLTEES